MNNVIEFVGLIMFLTVRGTLVAHLPDFSAENHDAFLAAPQGTADFHAWGTGKPDGTFVNKGKVWEYVKLAGGLQLRLKNATGGGVPTPPESLPHLRSGCCSSMVLKESFPTAATLTMEQGSTSCVVDGGRRDAVLNVASASGLQVVAADGSAISFSSDAKILIGNTPLGSLRDQKAASHTMSAKTDPAQDDFLNYYKLAVDPSACRDVPSHNPKCAGDKACNGDEGVAAGARNAKAASKAGKSTRKMKARAPMVVLLGPDIDCSNSQYP